MYTQFQPAIGRALVLGCVLAPALCWGGLKVELMTNSQQRVFATYEGARIGDYGIRGNTAALQGIWDIECSEGDGLESHSRHVSIIGTCGTLSWQLGIASYPEGGALAFQQQNWHSEQGPWWLVSESSSILRPLEDEARSEISFFFEGNPVEVRAGPNRLPAWHQPPGFWLLGDPAFIDMDSVRHFFDLEKVPPHLIEVLEGHTRGMRFLKSLLPVKPLSPVFWMGLDEWQASIGGAAGTGLILVNYPVDEMDLNDGGRAFTLYVVLHEHAHQAVKPTGVLWIDESLASFLAIKAVKETSPSLYPVLADAFMESGRRAEVSLSVLGERAAAGDGEAYAQIYQGAAFWQTLDDAMTKKGTPVGLLAVLPELLARVFSSTGNANLAEMEKITGLSESELSNILNTYVGVDS